MLTDRQVWALSTIRIICGCISVIFSLLFFSVIFFKTLWTTKRGVQLRHKIAQFFSKDKLQAKHQHSNLQSDITATPASPTDVVTAATATATATSPYDDSHLRHKSGHLKKPYFFRFLSVRLVCFLQFCSMMSAVADLYGYETMHKGGDEAMCIVQGIQTQFFRIATGWWSLSISMWLIYSIVFAKKYEMWVEALSHFFSWIAAITCTLLPLIGRTYGKTFPQYGWCWINRNTTLGVVWAMTTYFGVLWAIFGIILISYAILLRKIIVVMRTSSSVLSTRSHVNKIQFLAIAKLSIIPALFLLILVFPTVNVIYELAAKDENFWLLLLNTVSFPLHGFLNALLFMLNPSFLYECFTSIKRNLRGMKKKPASPVLQTPAAGAITHVSTLSAASLDESAEEIDVPIDQDMSRSQDTRRSQDIRDIPAASQTVNNSDIAVV